MTPFKATPYLKSHENCTVTSINMIRLKDDHVAPNNFIVFLIKFKEYVLLFELSVKIC
jgi:hypothetical protein